MMQQFTCWAALALMTAHGALATDAEVLYQNLCAQCHGVSGEGKAEVKAPSIASLPSWYVLRQIENFQHDRRGAHPQDTEGQMMRAIAKVLTPELSRAVAVLVEKLPRAHPPPTIVAETAQGQELFAERCMECHRFNGEGEIVFGAAPLVGLQDWYIAAQLRKFKTGVRGAEKTDTNGQKMVHVTASFIDSQEMIDSVSAYILKLGKQMAARSSVFGAD
ncbi:MAG: cytochrome c4 [Roseimicrobium sp.]